MCLALFKKVFALPFFPCFHCCHLLTVFPIWPQLRVLTHNSRIAFCRLCQWTFLFTVAMSPLPVPPTFPMFSHCRCRPVKKVLLHPLCLLFRCFPMLFLCLISPLPVQESNREPQSPREPQRVFCRWSFFPDPVSFKDLLNIWDRRWCPFFSLLPCAPRIFSCRRSRHGFLERGKLRATTCCAQKSFCACPCAHNSVRASTCTNLKLNPKTLNSKLSFLPACRPALGLFSASCRPERAA